jgi:anti-sigma factor ChrR (cupin superfamily)
MQGAAPDELRLNADFGQRVVMRASEAAWTPSPAPGVERRMLDRIGGEVARATSIVRYAPGSRFPEHAHEGGEEFLVLEGVFSDSSGDFPAGAYVRNPPGTAHAPWTEPGCVLFVKLRQMRPDDCALVRIDTTRHGWIVEGERRRMLLFEGPGEKVELRAWPVGASEPLDNPKGLEVLVLAGGFEDAQGRYVAGDWLRLPPGMDLAMRTASGCRAFIKTGQG